MSDESAPGLAEKITVALSGSKEQRATLICDPNPLVVMSVLGSPKTTMTEIESFAAMKNVSELVLREIGNHREWTKQHGVISRLLRNPRTPVDVAHSLVSRLTIEDLSAVSIDPDIPGPIRREAQRMLR